MPRQRILVGVRDVKVGEYGILMVLATAMEAKRLFLVAVEDRNSQLGRFPNDFTMAELGLFDPETGRITPHELPVDVTPYSERDAVIAKRELAGAPK